MAKPKKNVIVKVVRTNPNIIHAWCDQPKRWLSEIAQIEGVASVTFLATCLSVWGDLRYDVEEVASEIEELLTAEAPEVFKE